MHQVPPCPQSISIRGCRQRSGGLPQGSRCSRRRPQANLYRRLCGSVRCEVPGLRQHLHPRSGAQPTRALVPRFPSMVIHNGGLTLRRRFPRSQTLFGNAVRETLFRVLPRQRVTADAKRSFAKRVPKQSLGTRAKAMKLLQNGQRRSPGHGLAPSGRRRASPL